MVLKMNIILDASSYHSATPLLNEMEQKRSRWSWTKSYLSVDKEGTIKIVEFNFFERILRFLFSCYTPYKNTHFKVVKKRLHGMPSNQGHVIGVKATVNAIWKKINPQSWKKVNPGLPTTTTTTTGNPPTPSETTSTNTATTTTLANVPPPPAQLTTKKPIRLLACLDQDPVAQRVIDFLEMTDHLALLTVNSYMVNLPTRFPKMGNPFAGISIDERVAMLRSNMEVLMSIVADNGTGGAGDSTDVAFTTEGRLIAKGVTLPSDAIRLEFGSRSHTRGSVTSSLTKDLPGFRPLGIRALVPIDSYHGVYGPIDLNKIGTRFYTFLFDLCAASVHLYSKASVYREREKKYVEKLKQLPDRARPQVLMNTIHEFFHVPGRRDL